MSILLHEAEKLVGRMTTIEKAQLFLSIARQITYGFPGLEWDPQVCGGNPCVVRTRIPVWLVEQARRSGMDELQILRAFPSLKPADLLNARAYAQAYPDEIERQIRENETG